MTGWQLCFAPSPSLFFTKYFFWGQNTVFSLSEYCFWFLKVGISALVVHVPPLLKPKKNINVSDSPPPPPTFEAGSGPKKNSVLCPPFFKILDPPLFQSYAKTVPSRMKLTMREPAFMGSMTTDT